MDTELVKVTDEILNERSGMRSITFMLKVNGVDVVCYSVCIGSYKGTASIDYFNLFAGENSEYLNKGYATLGLNNVCETLFNEDLVCEIMLQISELNKKSRKVASKSGFIELDRETYTKVHPDVNRVYDERLKYFIKQDPDNKDFYITRKELYLTRLEHISKLEKEKRK